MTAYKYSDIWLLPNLCRVKSRSDIDTSIQFGPRKFKVPVVPSNMLCTIDIKLTDTLADNGYFYVYHRFNNDTLQFCLDKTKQNRYISISVGVNDDSKDIIADLKAHGITPDYVTIDIAHGHSPQVVGTIQHIKSLFPSTFVIAGNVTTAAGVSYLEIGGADAIKVGIGQGSVCTTRHKTGFTMPMFTCVQECANVANVPIIADGGVTYNCDIVKAVYAGADMVMAGGIFAKLIDSPAGIQNGKKVYFGSASIHTKEHTGQASKNIEGTSTHVIRDDMTYLDKLDEIRNDMQSAVSYAGGTVLSDIRTAKYCIHPE